MFPSRETLLIICALFSFLPYGNVFAEEVRFNNDNWLTLPHPKVLMFSVDDAGNVSGITETGITFIQYNIPADLGIRIQRFEIQDHYHYVVDGEVVYAADELSLKLASRN